MVGRFESGELRREAIAHEALTARQGLAGKCWCLVGTFILAVGLYSVLGGGSLFGGLTNPLADLPSRRSPPAVLVSPAPSTSPGPSSDFGYDDESEFRDHVSRQWTMDDGRSRQPHPWEEPSHLGTDYTLMSIVVAVIFVAIAVIRSCLAPAQNLWSQPGGAYAPWGAGGSPGMYGQTAAPGTLFGRRYIDVKPGELRGGAAGGLFGSSWMDQGAGMAGGSMDWARGPQQAAGGWPPLAQQGPGAGMGGSWCSPVPSPYSNIGPSGLPGAPGGAGGWPGVGGYPNFGLGNGMGGSNLPSEPEVADTYVSFGNELQRWVQSLNQIIDKQVIESLIQELDESDKFWTQNLAAMGWKLTFEAPAYPGMGPQAQSEMEVSVFNTYLPPQLLQLGGPQSGELWRKRQLLESYLVHPDFPPAQRQFVLTRLREWRDRGLANSIRAEWRYQDQLPTDAHILENIIIKMLNITMEFDKCFRTSAPNQPPVGKHLGQSPVAYLRQVTDQTVTPKPPPHYEVWTLTRVWKLRPGGRNLFEALAILITTLKRHGDPGQRSFQSFPPVIRNAIEPPGIGSTIANLPGKLFPSMFGGGSVMGDGIGTMPPMGAGMGAGIGGGIGTPTFGGGGMGGMFSRF